MFNIKKLSSCRFLTAVKALNLSLAGSVLWAGAALAQVGLSPLVVELDAERGRAQGVITVTNDTEDIFRARVYMEPFTYDQEEGFQTVESSPHDLSPYLRFSPIELEVPAAESRKIRFVAQLPPSLAEGEYRGVLFTETLVETLNEEGVSVILKTRVGSTIYVRHGDIAPNLTVNGAAVDLEDNRLELLVNNNGPASTRPRVNWQLSQSGTEVATGETEPISIIAGGGRSLGLGNLGESLPNLGPGQYQLSGELIWSDDNDWETLSFSVDLTVPNAVSTVNP
ncbi:p pilus assembly chaperone [Leptolyngbya sp. Heron Island J]|uniref:hypothetical protein n=1 Tax=Leptolyngbya sp. Heron Island J TaxID=1385935 RepID=UPI0003B9863D|nr:hypothetical protein [Leptolyngbya sp. Heron Island J]ESA32007.1 p pilus assembly chaperone [Leptolyngbya sp. Heron Island J]